jgi:hypothetical protein
MGFTLRKVKAVGAVWWKSIACAHKDHILQKQCVLQGKRMVCHACRLIFLLNTFISNKRKWLNIGLFILEGNKNSILE